MRRFTITVLVALVALVAVVAGVGWTLPVQHVASVRAFYEVSPEEVFEAISDYERHPEWRPSVHRIEELPGTDGRPAWQEVGTTGPLPMELVELDPPRRMVTVLRSDGMPFGGRWIYEVDSAPGGATLTITEEGEVYSVIFRFVSRFLMGHHGTMTTFVQDLGRRYGAEVEVEVVR